MQLVSAQRELRNCQAASERIKVTRETPQASKGTRKSRSHGASVRGRVGQTQACGCVVLSPQRVQDDSVRIGWSCHTTVNR